MLHIYNYSTISPSTAFVKVNDKQSWRKKCIGRGVLGGDWGFEPQKPKHFTYSQAFKSISHIPKIICNIPYPKIKITKIPISLNKMDQYPISRNTLNKPLNMHDVNIPILKIVYLLYTEAYLALLFRKKMKTITLRQSFKQLC